MVARGHGRVVRWRSISIDAAVAGRFAIGVVRVWFAVVDAVVFGAKPRTSGNVGGAKPIRVVFCRVRCAVLAVLVVVVFCGVGINLSFFYLSLSATKTNAFIGKLSCRCARSSL